MSFDWESHRTTRASQESPRRGGHDLLGAVLLAAVGVLVVGAPCVTQAAPHEDVGVGMFLGEPTGLTVKGFLHPNHALVGYASWDFTDEAITIALDYQLHSNSWYRRGQFSLGGLVGLGGKIGIDAGKRHDKDVLVGLRVPLGVWMYFDRVPLELTLELVPGIGLVPATRADFDGGLGIRYFF